MLPLDFCIFWLFINLDFLVYTTFGVCLAAFMNLLQVRQGSQGKTFEIATAGLILFLICDNCNFCERFDVLIFDYVVIVSFACINFCVCFMLVFCSRCRMYLDTGLI